jgi:hypothetical protein
MSKKGVGDIVHFIHMLRDYSSDAASEEMMHPYMNTENIGICS